MAPAASTQLLTLVREQLDLGLTDPREIAKALLPNLSRTFKVELCEWALPRIVRGMLGTQRRLRIVGEDAAVYVPGVGWKSRSDLTADECDEVAASYEEQAKESQHLAEWYRGLAKEIRAGGLSTVGDLAWYRDELSTRTKKGLEAAKKAGVVLGRPVVLDPQTIAHIVELRRAGGTLTSIAEELNRSHIPTAHGGRWHMTTVRRILAKADAA